MICAFLYGRHISSGAEREPTAFLESIMVKPPQTHNQPQGKLAGYTRPVQRGLLESDSGVVGVGKGLTLEPRRETRQNSDIKRHSGGPLLYAS